MIELTACHPVRGVESRVDVVCNGEPPFSLSTTADQRPDPGEGASHLLPGPGSLQDR
jgi:hypothetical protein